MIYRSRSVFVKLKQTLILHELEAFVHPYNECKELKIAPFSWLRIVFWTCLAHYINQSIPQNKVDNLWTKHPMDEHDSWIAARVI